MKNKNTVKSPYANLSVKPINAPGAKPKAEPSATVIKTGSDMRVKGDK